MKVGDLFSGVRGLIPGELERRQEELKEWLSWMEDVNFQYQAMREKYKQTYKTIESLVQKWDDIMNSSLQENDPLAQKIHAGEVQNPRQKYGAFLRAYNHSFVQHYGQYIEAIKDALGGTVGTQEFDKIKKTIGLYVNEKVGKQFLPQDGEEPEVEVIFKDAESMLHSEELLQYIDADDKSA